jgi:phosphatidylinositol glycan class B
MLFGELKETIRKDSKLQLLLLASVIVQVIMCITAIGIYHPDQHFQLIEFSSAQLHKPFGYVWEFDAHIRPSLQVYLFSGYRILCGWLGLNDPFLQMTILQVLFGLALFVLFNSLALWYLRDGDRRILYWVLFILNFSWWIPYTRTLFSSEMLSSLLFFGAVFWYVLKSGSGRTEAAGAGGDGFASRWLVPLLTGFLFSLSFYARFQTAFAILGFGCWMLFFERKYFKLFPLIAGFIIGTAINIELDHGFYHHWIFTPYTYYKVNILEGKAAGFGTSPFIVYIGELMGITFAPPISILLLYFGFRAAILKKLSNPLTLAVLFFIVGHCIVAHKEDRFLFPVLSVLPIFVGWGLPDLMRWYQTRKEGLRKWIKGIAVFSITINLIVLVLLFFTPYCQALHFASQLRHHFKNESVTIYTVPRTPLETDAHLPFVYYQEGSRNFTWKTVKTADSMRYFSDKATYFATSYNDIKHNKQLPDSLGYERQFCSSEILWGVNTMLQSMGINTINDVWVLYKKK